MESKFPRVDVSYAPTRSFVKAFPKELSVQQAKFTQPTWAQRMGEPLLPPDEEAPLPPKEKEEEEVAPVVEKVKEVIAKEPGLAEALLPLVLGAAVFLAAYYGTKYIVRWLSENGEVVELSCDG